MSSTHAIGVDLGGTKILAGVVTREGEVLRRHERATPKTQDELYVELDAAVDELMTDEVGALGFGIPGPIDQLTGGVYEAVNTP
ncbi:MAG TPA: ROK family protein, partial [Gaiellaceae bacterium]